MEFFEFIIIVLLVTVFVGCAFLAFEPALIANKLVSLLTNKSYKPGEQEGFWKLFEQVQRGRMYGLAALGVLLAAFGTVDVVLFFRFLGQVVFTTQAIFSVVLIIVMFVGYVAAQFYNYGKIRIAQTEHGRKADAQRILDNLSITSGMVTPQLVVLAHTNPTIFSIRKNFGQTIIYITSALLNLCNDNELEAVLAHEQAYHIARRNSHFRLVHNIVVLIKLLAFFTLYFVLYFINPSAPLAMLIGLAVLYGNLAMEGLGSFGVNQNVDDVKGEIIIRLANPPLMLAVFLSYSVEYLLSWRETVFADLKGVELTRYPQGMYNLLDKLDSYRQPTDSLPQEYSHLYFTGELTVQSDIPMPQPTVSERMEILEKLDQTLEATSPREVVFNCPVCRVPFSECVAGEFPDDKLYYTCQNNQHVWFDNASLYQISSPAFSKQTAAAAPLMTSQPEIPLRSCLCPRCGIPLIKIPDPFIPSSIEIWHCNSCQGDLLSLADFKSYAAYRNQKEQQTQIA